MVRDRLFDVALDVMPMVRTVTALQRGKLRHKRVYRDSYGSVVYFRGAQDNLLVGTLYRPKGAGPHPAILLLHGSTPAGRKLGMYRVMGRELAARGYIVLCIDQRGFGDSDDPQHVDRAEDFDWVQDSRVAVQYLAAQAGVDPERIAVIGHSFGGDVAISTARSEPLVRKVIAIGPGRRFEQRMVEELHYYRRRTMRYMGLEEPIPEGVFRCTYAALHIGNHHDYFTQPGHTPLLLLDGEQESAADRQYLHDVAQRIAEPRVYQTLPGDHYANVANIGKLVVYDQHALTQMISTIHTWLLKT